MRLWHEQMINRLPKNQLLGQHRECCALRGNGWEKKHRTVDYVFLYSPYFASFLSPHAVKITAAHRSATIVSVKNSFFFIKVSPF